MRTLYLIGGPMGVGKSAVAQHLKRDLPAAVLLDGDWCWNMDPFVVDDETKKMVLENITFVLNNFLGSSRFENIIFSWVMPKRSIIDAILSGIDTTGYRVLEISLVCSDEVLRERLLIDILVGLRSPDIISRSLDRLASIRQIDTLKIDTDGLTSKEVSEVILRL